MFADGRGRCFAAWLAHLFHAGCYLNLTRHILEVSLHGSFVLSVFVSEQHRPEEARAVSSRFLPGMEISMMIAADR